MINTNVKTMILQAIKDTEQLRFNLIENDIVDKLNEKQQILIALAIDKLSIARHNLQLAELT